MDANAQWVLGGLVASAGLGCLLLYLSDDGKASSHSVSSLSREKVLLVLKELKKEITPAFITLASFALSIKEQTGNKISEDQIREILVSQSPIQQQLKRSEAKVYSLHSTTEAELQSAIETLFAKDPAIQELVREMKENLEFAYRGRHPEMRSSLPDFVSPELILKCLSEMYDVTKAIAFARIEEMRVQGIEISPYSERFMKGTQDMEGETEREKQRVFEKYGLASTDDSAGMLLHNAIQKYSVSDPDFVGKIANIENAFKVTMQSIMQGALPPAERDRLREVLDPRPLIEELEM